MGFDVNSQGSSATVNIPPNSSHNPSLPPKPPATSTPVIGGKKPTPVTTSCSTLMSSRSGGYSLYSLIKKQSQSSSAPQKPVISTTLQAKSIASSVPVSLLKKPSGELSVTTEKPSTELAMTSTQSTVRFADPIMESTSDDEQDCILPHRLEHFYPRNGSFLRNYL